MGLGLRKAAAIGERNSATPATTTHTQHAFHRGGPQPKTHWGIHLADNTSSLHGVQTPNSTLAQIRCGVLHVGRPLCRNVWSQEQGRFASLHLGDLWPTLREDLDVNVGVMWGPAAPQSHPLRRYTSQCIGAMLPFRDVVWQCSDTSPIPAADSGHLLVAVPLPPPPPPRSRPFTHRSLCT